ncbi:hypothetical protein HGRIS_001155 [Hohenbuehelia grisea]|uniref:Uncharacterized protein n=1 Tax=Hohenbuehelia grisea TaxID=104357 RepID=A0ABR3JP71_9AGAR
MRSAVRGELMDKVHKNDGSMFLRLDIDTVSDAVSDAYCNPFAVQNRRVLSELRTVVAAAASSRAKSSLSRAADHMATLDEHRL